MGERRAALLCGAGFGGFLFLAGIMGLVAGLIDAAALVEGFGGTVSPRTAEVAESSAAVAFWGGLVAITAGIVLFTICVTATRRRRASGLTTGI